jgi:hypothetical protein
MLGHRLGDHIPDELLQRSLPMNPGSYPALPAGCLFFLLLFGLARGLNRQPETLDSGALRLGHLVNLSDSLGK